MKTTFNVDFNKTAYGYYGTSSRAVISSVYRVNMILQRVVELPLVLYSTSSPDFLPFSSLLSNCYLHEHKEVMWYPDVYL